MFLRKKFFNFTLTKSIILLLIIGISLISIKTTLAWNIATATYDNVTYTTSTQSSTPYETNFKTDGTKMYVLGGTAVFQYSLSSAWDNSSASYDTVTFSVASQEATPKGLFFKSDGSTMYIIGATTDSVFQYTLTTPWDLSTASYASKQSPSNGSLDATSIKVHFNTTGTKMYITGESNGNIYQYSLSSAWDASTATYDSVTYSLSSQITNLYATTFNDDGTKLYAIGSNDNLYQYALTTAWDLSTTMYETYTTGNPDTTTSYGMVFKTDGTKLYLTKDQGDLILRFSITATDLTTPYINAFSPLDDATDIALGSNLVITFTENVDAESGDITLYKSDDTLIETFDVTSDVSGTGTSTITINPASDLAELTSYYIKIAATAFDDAASNSYAGITDTTTWSFTTIDVTNPTISTLSPTDDEIGLDITSNLIITFSENVDAESGNITLYDSNDTQIEAFDVTSDISGTGTDTITINPTSDLSGSTSYYIQIATTAFDDSSSNSYAGITDTTTWSFTTISTNRRTTVPQTDSTVIENPDLPEPSPDDLITEEPTETENITKPEESTDTEETVEPVELTKETSNLIKLPGSTTVYKINDDGTRSVFINEKQYFSHYNSFEIIKEISLKEIQNFPLGAPVTYKKGSLIKLTSIPKVFLVGDNNELHWIENEDLFYSLGYTFEMVNDVLDSFFPLYTISENITQ